MKSLFMTILRRLDESENITEALMYESGKFAEIKFKSEDGSTYSIAISKEETDGNNSN